MRLGLGLGLSFLQGGGDPPNPPNALLARAGFFTVRGDSMSQAYSFGVDQGSFALTGEAVTFSQGTVPILTAGSGTFTLTGEAATLTGANTIAASQGSFLLSASAAALNIGMSAAQGAFTLTGEAATLTAPSAYTGPGDTNGAAKFFGGLRAFSAAYATGLGNAVDIVDSTYTGGATGNPATITILANGDLDAVTLNNWIGLHGTASVKQLYDQSGNGLHFTQATLAAMPTINMTGINSKPALSLSGAQWMTNATGVTQAIPLTVVAVASRTGNTGAYNAIFGSASPINLYFNNSSGFVSMYAGNALPTAAAAENAAHSLQALFNDTSSAIYVDGGASVGMSTVGVNGSSGVMFLGSIDSSPHFTLTGLIAEVGIWAGDKTGNAATVYTQEHAYWNV